MPHPPKSIPTRTLRPPTAGRMRSRSTALPFRHPDYSSRPAPPPRTRRARSTRGGPVAPSHFPVDGGGARWYLWCALCDKVLECGTHKGAPVVSEVPYSYAPATSRGRRPTEFLRPRDPMLLRPQDYG